MKAHVEAAILCANIFLLTLAIGLNSHSLYTWLYAPPEPEYCHA